MNQTSLVTRVHLLETELQNQAVGMQFCKTYDLKDIHIANMSLPNNPNSVELVWLGCWWWIWIGLEFVCCEAKGFPWFQHFPWDCWFKSRISWSWTWSFRFYSESGHLICQYVRTCWVAVFMVRAVKVPMHGRPFEPIFLKEAQRWRHILGMAAFFKASCLGKPNTAP